MRKRKRPAVVASRRFQITIATLAWICCISSRGTSIARRVPSCGIDNVLQCICLFTTRFDYYYQRVNSTKLLIKFQQNPGHHLLLGQIPSLTNCSWRSSVIEMLESSLTQLVHYLRSIVIFLLSVPLL